MSDTPLDARTTRLLRLLGLGVRSRGAVVGVERVREAVGRGTLQLAVVAPDASPHSLHKVRPLLTARGVPVVEGPSAAILGQAVGRETTAVVGVTDANLARGIQQDQGTARGALGSSDTGRTGTVSGRDAHVGPSRRDFRRVD
ncbi:MAG TPA: ribosomal L7Ae/L30e/S12e/Gadd45 family protein [Gemmatirosa sp.]